MGEYAAQLVLQNLLRALHDIHRGIHRYLLPCEDENETKGRSAEDAGLTGKTRDIRETTLEVGEAKDHYPARRCYLRHLVYPFPLSLIHLGRVDIPLPVHS